MQSLERRRATGGAFFIKNRMRLILSLLACVAMLPACSDQPAATGNNAGPAPALRGTDKLVGQWNGPEGTFLLLAGVSGKYAITIRNLDGPRTFHGNGGRDAIRFERDAKAETIRATDGAGTGMKWLAGKKDCIVIEPGEGYCRD